VWVFGGYLQANPHPYPPNPYPCTHRVFIPTDMH
jgi:hypothetical protein